MSTVAEPEHSNKVEGEPRRALNVDDLVAPYLEKKEVPSGRVGSLFEIVRATHQRSLVHGLWNKEIPADERDDYLDELVSLGFADDSDLWSLLAEAANLGWSSGEGRRVQISSARSEPTALTTDQGERPVVVMERGALFRDVERGARLLMRDTSLFQREGSLCCVRRWGGDDKAKHEVDRPAGSPVIRSLGQSAIKARLTRIADWQRFSARKNKNLPATPGNDVVSAILDEGSFPGVPTLAGISATPLVREDGSVSCDPGYDARTGFYYSPIGAPPEVPETPTRDDARAARDKLLGVVVDFPFEKPAGPDAWIAGLLSIVARHLCPCVPMYLVDASTPGTGKTLLVDAAMHIALGANPPRSPAPPNDNECRKRLFSHMIAGDSAVVFDNLPNESLAGWSSLDSAVTAPTYTDRILGATENPKVKNNLTIFCTGNNVGIKGDAGRRMVRVRLETDLEHPESRTDFIHKSLLPWINKNRGELLGAALTILSAYLRAGMPDRARQIGSFERWSDVVRSAIMWSGGADVVDLLANRVEDLDPAATAHVALLAAWYDEGPMTVGQAVKAIGDDEQSDLAIAAFAGLPKNAKGLTPQGLGARLRGYLNRRRTFETADGRRLVGRFVSVPGRTPEWRVEVD